MSNLGTLQGMKVIENRLMVEDGEPYEVARTWKERLFTWPWQPFKIVNIIIPKVPLKEVWRLGDNTLVMHPDFFEEMKKSLGQKTKQ